MLARTLGLAGALALSANALMILPTVSIEPLNNDALAALVSSPLAVVDPQTQVLKMDCTDCPFLLQRRRGTTIWSQKPVENTLMLKFNVGADQKSLEVNGVRAYPTSPFRWPKTLRAPQLPAGADAKKIKGCMRNAVTVSEYTWAFHVEGVSAEEGGEVIFGTFTPQSIEGESIHIPSAVVKMIRDAEGRLTIASVMQKDVKDTVPAIGGSNGECHGPALFCKLKDIMTNSYKGLKSAVKGGCKKSKNAHGHKNLISRPLIKTIGQDIDGNPVEIEEPAHGFARFAHVFAHVSKMVLLPMLIGIAAGFLVYAVGMAAGLFIAFVWVALRKWRAGGRGTYVHLSEDETSAEEQIDVKDMLKSEYVDEKQDPLPVYKETDDKEVAPQ